MSSPLGAVRPSPPNVAISPAAEAAEWIDAGRERTPASPPEWVREQNPDELVCSDVTLATDETYRALGDDGARRSAVLYNRGASALQLAPNLSAFLPGATVGATVFVLAAGATLTITSTRELYARATAAASLSVLVERGTRDKL